MRKIVLALVIGMMGFYSCSDEDVLPNRTLESPENTGFTDEDGNPIDLDDPADDDPVDGDPLGGGDGPSGGGGPDDGDPVKNETYLTPLINSIQSVNPIIPCNPVSVTRHCFQYEVYVSAATNVVNYDRYVIVKMTGRVENDNVLFDSEELTIPAGRHLSNKKRIFTEFFVNRPYGDVKFEIVQATNDGSKWRTRTYPINNCLSQHEGYCEDPNEDEDDGLYSDDIIDGLLKNT
ncbi:MAG: hypothetical protein AAGA66_04820 [Bacteroidota bacterium]